MRKRTYREQGFTLIELIVVFACIQVLVALAVPAFGQYVKKSKSSEAVTHLNSLFKGASSYYQKGQVGSQGLTSADAGHCIVGTTSLLPTTPSAQKQHVDFQNVAEYRAIGFNLTGQAYYGFRIVSASATSVCKQSANTTLYTFMAMGDLDGDNIFSRFELATASNDNNELYHQRSIYILNESE
ncbi:MAG: prepilin-type N-terminal cleavage/methylation domain-containing protein [Myxococcales bacterium]|nr:MAG: prepilin-type N-terminal cleavage/methylation domain-containing protein [Myxococcales bacterium]